MLILNERPEQIRNNASARDNLAVEREARLLGIEVYDIPSNWSRSYDVEDILAYLPENSGSKPCFVNGFIPSLEDYLKLDQALSRKGYTLLNSPEACARCLAFHHAYPLLEGITPTSFLLSDLEQIGEAIGKIGFPMFVKGSVRSLKKEGWKSCAVDNREELEVLVQRLLASEYQSRGHAILRELVALRYDSVADNGFPMGREYRIFLYKGEILSMGYYWDAEDEFGTPGDEDLGQIQALVEEAYRRLDVPYLALDVGQLQNGNWIVIEPGDAQFAGFGRNDIRKVLVRLKDAVERDFR